MLIDLRQLAGDEDFEADVCVVGAGAAGITLARELAAAGHSVIIAESGGLAYEEPTQALYSGRESGTILGSESQYLASSRLRYFGGTTGHWNGWCRPLDEDDFSPRPWASDVSWPIGRADLDPYYARASPVLQISPFDYDEDSVGGLRLFEDDEVFRTNYFHLSPTRFGQVYHAELEANPRIRVLLYANLRRIATTENARQVTSFEIVRLDGVAFPVRARQFVLAAGGVENARLLLANREAQPQGLGNGSDQVGRNFMDHPYVRFGYVTMPYWRWLVPKVYSESFVEARDHKIQGVLRVRAPVRSRDELLNSLVVFKHPVENVMNWPLSPEVGEFVKQQHLLAGHPEPEKRTTYYGWVMIHGEQSPNPASRVTLDDEVDALGVPKSRLDWQLREQDAKSLVKVSEHFARRVGLHTRGRMRLITREDNIWTRTSWSWHHIGTTRMHEDPKKGVVDADCRVHGMDNLFVAGSSVFTTSGASNPTYTIVALALRLSDHLNTRLTG